MAGGGNGGAGQRTAQGPDSGGIGGASRGIAGSDGGGSGQYAGGGGGGGADAAGGAGSGAAGGSAGTSTNPNGVAGASGGGGGGGYSPVETAFAANGTSGGAGGAGSNSFGFYGAGGGGAGGYGAIVKDATAGTNTAIITGGAGGVGGMLPYGTSYGTPAYTGSGGSGGLGAQLTAANAIASNSGTIRGGSGGAGNGGYNGGGGQQPDYGASGGDGGVGFQLTAGGGQVGNQGTIQGGAGGAAGPIGSSNAVQNAGVGGAGLIASSATISNTNMIIGGAGGTGAYLVAGYGRSGNGGTGGAGIAGSRLNITNSGSLTGGAGGATGYPSGALSGTGGTGGAGVDGGYVSIVNSGSITGGAGGAPGLQTSAFKFGIANYAGYGGTGGAGIAGSNLSITNSGSIIGGAGGAAIHPSGNYTGIPGAAGDAIDFTGGRSSLTLGSTTNGTTTIGTLSGGLGVTGTLTLATPASATLSNVIHNGAGVGALVYDSTSTLTLSGVNTFSGGTTIDAGTLSISADSGLGATTGKLVLAGGTLEATAPLSSARFIDLNASSTIQVDAGSGTTPAITSLTGTISGGGNDVLTKTGTGTLELSGTNTIASVMVGAGTLDLTQARAGAKVITFAGSQATPATLMLESGAQPTMGTITAPGPTFGDKLTNFGTNDQLDLAGFTYSALDTATLSSTNGTFTLTFADNSGDATTGKTESFSLGGTLSAAYIVQDGGSNGVLIEAVTCFAQGTRIYTTRDDVAVEDLRVGDFVMTASGDLRPIRWIGHREVDCRRHPRPQDAMPVRVAAHAFGADLPERDLYLSPGHPVLVGADEDGKGGHLVPIMCLINGTTVRRVAVDAVTYWHVELDAHDILLAEGLPAESYIDLGSRPWFDGADGVLYDPDMALPGLPGRCRPVAIDGPVVEAERRRLDAVFAIRLASACAWPGAEDASLPL